jgi:hypothetical protein
MSVLEEGEIVHIVERRFFVDDVRRHFVGVVKAYDENSIRIVGYVWVYNVREGKFVRRREKRERILVLGDKLIINVLPRTIRPEEIVYVVGSDRRMAITDKKNFSLDISEFVDVK